MDMKKTRLITLVVACVLALAAGGALWVLGRGNLAADIVAREAVKIAREKLGAELALENAAGNPLSGFHFGRMSLAYKGKPVMSAGDMSVSFKLLSLLGSSPTVKDLVLAGLDMDLDQAADFMRQFEGGGPSKLEIGRLVVEQGLLRTRFGQVKVPKMQASVSGSRYRADFEAETRGVPFSGKVRAEHEGEKTVLEKLDLAVRKGKASFSGSVRPQLGLQGNLEGVDIADVPVFWPGAGKPGDLKGTVSGPITLTGTWEEPVIEGTLKLAGGQLHGFAAEAAEGAFSYGGGTLKVEGLSGKSGEGTFSGNIEAAVAKKPAAVSGNLSAKNVSLETFKSRFPELEGLKGKVDVPRVSFSGTAQALRLQGRVESAAIEFKGDVLERASANLSMAANRLMSVSGSGNWMSSPVTFNGTVALGKAPVLDMAVKASSLSLEKLSTRFSGLQSFGGKGNVRAELDVSGTLKAPRIQGKVASDRLVAKGETLEAASAGFSLSGETVTVPALSARWQDALVTGSGTLSKIRSELPGFSFSGSARGLEMGRLASRVPDLEEMQLSGTGNADWKVSGTSKDTAFSVTFSSSRLETPDFRLSGAGADVKGRLREKEESMPLDIRFSADAAALGKARLESLSGSVNRTKEAFEVPSFSARLAGGSVKGSGRLTPGKEKEPARIDIKASASGVGLQTLSSWAGIKDPVQGKADLSLAVSGTTKEPALDIEASVPALQAMGLKLNDVRLKGAGKPSDMTFDPVTASVGGGRMAATGRARSPEGAGLSLEFSAKGTDLDLRTLAAGLQGTGEAVPTGKIDLSLKGSFSDGKAQGTGELASKGSIRFMGTTLSDLRAPLSLQKGRIQATNVTASAYGGKIAGSLSMGEAKRWNARFSLSEADLDAYLKEQMKLDGRVTGRFDVDFDGGGTLGTENSTEGSGTFVSRDGAVSGFKAVKAISALYGRSSVRYETLSAPYRMQGDRLVLSDGRADAFSGDPLYEYVNFAGTVGPKKALALDVNGRVNVQGVNALVGGVRGGVLQAGKSVQEILQGFIQGVSGGMTARDIRMVRGRVVGTTDKPSLTNLRIEGATLQPQQQQQAAPETAQPQEQAPVQAPPDIRDTIQQEILKRIFKP